MPEVIPKWVRDYELCDVPPEPSESVPVLTLDQIEAWILGIGNAMALTEGTDLHIQAGYHAAINDLLAQVQAWKGNEKVDKGNEW